MTIPQLDATVRQRVFERMLLMRRLEEGVFELADRGAMVGHFHVYIGQEATGAADYLFARGQ